MVHLQIDSSGDVKDHVVQCAFSHDLLEIAKASTTVVSSGLYHRHHFGRKYSQRPSNTVGN
ncbi:hypothetical protein CHS0354_039394 [Potamilus streckersoni]|uniref:Uncharacterized protein n=1 Tax=Potamilus streckersoni TaxID=2493646 RepID=A0AAE0VNP5_9BIVA|nr:hypothetical protein CHS0354_039394 [Potamilus streckersoni]